MSGEGRTVWQAQDAAWWRRERIVLLGQEFGSEGPAVANWLECEAKAQNAGGLVKAGYATAAHGTFIEGGAARAREIVSYAVEIGFLEDFEEGERTFTATIAAYSADQGKGRAATRKADQRDRDQEGQDVTDDDESRSVTGSHAPVSETGQERTEEKNTSPASESPGNIAPRLFAYWQQECHHPQAKLTADRRRKCEARLREGYTEQQGREAINGAARAAFVNNEGKRFDDFELIFRSGSKLESFIERARLAPAANGHSAVSSRELAARMNRDAVA